LSEFIIDFSDLEEIKDHNGQREQRLASVRSLISAAKQHPTLQSLCGIHPDPENSGYPRSKNLNKFLKKNLENKNILNLSNQGTDDLMAMVVSYDLEHNHNIVSVNIENNCISEKNSIIDSIKDNVTLKSIYCNYQNMHLPNSR
jgi:RNA-binding protein YhbY